MTKCSFCGNANHTFKKADYIYRQKEKFMLFKNVPCEECDYCGERYYSAETLKKIEAEFFAVQNNSKQPNKKIEVAIEEFVI